VAGEALYVTHSAYLAQNARNLYYANGFERAGQEATFLSIGSSSNPFTFHRDGRPRGRISWAGFNAFASPSETRISAISTGIRSLRKFAASLRLGTRHAHAEDYLALGVRQSIFPAGQRNRLYDVFEKYLVLAERRESV